MNELFIKNPHSILAALKHRPQDVLSISPPSRMTEAWKAILEEAGPRKTQSGGMSGKAIRDRRENHSREGRHGGAGARIRARAPVSLSALIQAKTSGQHGLWVALDCVQDPQNVGSIFRTAGFYGVRGILMLEDRSSSLTETVYDVASGGLETVPFHLAVNLRQSLDAFKDEQIWVLGTSEHAELPLSEVPRDRSWVVVLGSEEQGLRRLTQENCDLMCAIPPRGKPGSLNVSVAAAVVLSTLTV